MEEVPGYKHVVLDPLAILKESNLGIKKKKEETNVPHHRYSMGEAFTAILPTFLSTLVLNMLDGLVKKFQEMMNGQDWVKDIPRKRALEILQAGQRGLSERIREMSSEEQFYYAYTFHSLTRSLVGYQGSLEQLEAAAETRMLVSLLVGIAHSPEEGVSEGRIGSDVLLSVVPVFSLMVHERGVVLIQNPTVLEAFERSTHLKDLTIKSSSLEAELLKEVAVMESEGWSEALVDKLEEKTDSEGEETETEKVVASEEAPVENRTSSIVNKQIAQFLLEGRTSLGAVFNGSEAKNDGDGNGNNIGEPVDHGMSAVYTDLAVNLPILPDVFQHCRQPTAFHCAAEPTGDESSTAVNVDALPMALHGLEGKYIQATVPEEDEDMEFQKKVSLCVKFFRRELRDGYKSVAHTEIDLTSGMVVESAAGPRWVSFGHNVRDRQTTIEDDLLWKLVSSRDASDCCAEDEGLNHLKEATQSASPPVESAGVIPPGFQHKCSRSNPLPPPRPPPSTSWCWKRRLESVTDPQQYICTASQEALEELDSECHETICHAIARAFGTDPAVTLIHLLHNNVSPLLFGVQDKHGNTPLHNAATAGNAAIARELVVLRPSAVCVRNHDCLTPLDIALDHRNDEMVECLLRELVQSAPDNSSVIQLLESCLVKSLKNGYTHFLQLILQLRTEHGLAIDFECTDSSGHTAWHYLKQAAPAVRAVVAELLQESDLQQPLLGRLLKSLSFDACPHSPRSRDSVKARAKSGSFSEYEVSPPLSNDEHSTVSDCESTVGERPTLPPAPLSPLHILVLLKSRNGRGQQSKRKLSQKAKLVTLSTFFCASGEFDKKAFKTWITRTVSRSSYKHLRLVVHQQLFAVFGFSPLKVSLTAKERRMALAVLDFVKSTNNQIPQEVENNLNALKNVLNSRRHETEEAKKVVLSSRPSKTEPVAQITKTANVKRIDDVRGKKKGTQSGASVPSKSETVKPLPQTDEKEQNHTTEDSGVCHSADPSLAQSQTWSTPTSEQSVGVSVLDFANPSNPLDVIHSHMRVYSQCCPRHTIKNTVVIGTSYPAADAFGPKRRYSTIKDLQSDPSHSQFDFSRQLSVQSSSNRNSDKHKVFDRVSLLALTNPHQYGGAATLLVEQETEGAGGAGGEAQSQANVGLESSTEPPLYCAPIESPPPNLSTESVSDVKTPSELVEQKGRVTPTTSTLCDNTQAHSEPTDSQPLEQATPPSDSVGGESAAVEPKDPVPTPLHSQEPHSDVCDPSTRDSTPDKEETVLPDGAGDEKAGDVLGVDVSTVAETEGDKEIQQFQPEFELPSQLDLAAQILPSLSQEEPPGTTEDGGPELEVVDNEVEQPLPAPKPLAVGEPSLELALTEIRRQLKEEQDNAVAKLREELKEQLKGELREGMREEYENLVTEREMKLTAAVVKLKEANSILVAELQRHTGFEHSNSESASDISVLLQGTDGTNTLSDNTSLEDQTTRRPQRYSHPYTDSSLPQKLPVPESRKRQRHKAEQRISLNTPSSPSSSDTRKHSKSDSVKKKKHSMSEVRKRQRHNTQDRLSLYRPSTSSSSDTREPSKRRPRRSRPRESVKKKKHSSSETGKRQKQRFSLYRLSTSSGSDTTEHSKKRQCRHRDSSSDSVKTETYSECETTLFDNHSSASTSKEPPTNPLTSPLHILKSGAGRRQTLRSKYKNRTKLVTLAKFFTATGRFNKEGFKTWLTAIVGRSSYNHLRTVVHHKLFAVFGFSSPKLRKLSRRERVIGRAVISLVSSKKFPVPPSVEDNLQSLKAVLDAQKKSSVSLPSKSEALEPLLHGPKIEKDQEESSVDGSAKHSGTDKTWTHPTPEECVGASLLHFANTSHLIHCPVKVCHPPQNTCPPYDTFGGNYYTIADQHSDPASHSQTDHTEELSAARSRDHEDSESHCVVPDITTPGEVELGQNDWARHSVSDHVVPDTPKPCEVEFKHNNWALAPHLVPSLVMQQLNKTTESHSSHCPRPKQSSELHPPTSSHTHQENIISETTSGPGHQGHNALVTAVGVESDTSLDFFSTSHSHHHETAQCTGSEASSYTPASKHQQKRDKETVKKGRKVAEDRRQFSSSESDTKPRPKRLKRLKKGEPQEKSSKQSSSTTDSSHDEPLPSKICASGNPPSFCEAVNKQHNVNSKKKDVEVSSSDSSGPCTVRPQPDNSCCSPFLAGLPKPTTVPQDTPNCSTAIALVRLHYKYCTNEIQIFNPHMAANLGEVIEELTGLFEHKLCTGGFTKMVIITDTENYYTDLDNIIQTCLLKKYYLQLVPRHQLKVGDPEQPHCISLSECFGERACVVGNPTLPPFVINGNRLRNLPGAAEEVAFLSHLFQCHPLTLKEASKEAVTNKLERARFAHLATHDYNKGLVLSDAVLTSSDIEQLLFENGPPVLVVLNCCGTADTVCERKGLESVALALLKVNVLAVVAVFGSVEDKLALEFAKLFYHYMIEVGLPATHALYNSQHEVYPPDSTHQYIYLGKDVKITK